MPKMIDETQIYAAAINIFMSLGYDGATTKEIADIAGVNEVTLFRKFGSKAGLFERAIAHQLADTPLNRLVYTGNLEADMLAIVEAYVETNATYGDIIAIILIELPRNPDLQGALDTPWRNVQGIIKIIQQYQTQGLLKHESPLAAISALIGPIMINQMFRSANLAMPVPAIDPRTHVESFLYGRKS
ncbi:MAG: TetR/AcrR family transcriptional regulator [Caldilineaceae bacterium]